MISKKRGRQEEDKITSSHNISSTIFLVYPSIIHSHVGRFLKNSWKDYVSLALCTKRLWNYYCDNDEFVKHMRFAYLHISEYMKEDYLLYSNIPLCIDWVWTRDCKDDVKDNLAPRFVRAGAAFGNLDIIYKYCKHLEEPMDPFPVFLSVVQILVNEKRDEAACFFVENPQLFNSYLTIDNQNALATLYFATVKNVLYVPKLYSFVKQKMQKLYDDNDEDLITTTLMAACTGPQASKKKTFAFFWNKTPHIRHARNFLVHMFERMEGQEVSNIPWVMSSFFMPFSKMNHQKDGKVTQTMNFEGGESFHFSKQPSAVEGEMICHFSYVNPQGLVGRFGGNFPNAWC